MRLFVYGTLRFPHSKRFGLGKDQLIATDVELFGYQMYKLGWYPGVKKTDDLSHFVIGDVFEVPENGTWGALNAYEGFPHLYVKHTVTIEGIGECVVYVYNHEVNPDNVIASGVWRNVN